MATPETVIAKMREASTAFSGMFHKMAAQSMFSGLFREIPTTAGQYGKLAGVFPIGEMEDAQGTATVEGLDAAEKLIKTKGRRYTGGIDYEVLMSGDSAFEGELSRVIMQSADVVLCDIEKRLTTKLESGTTDTDLFGNSFFNDTKTIPGSGISFDNSLSGAYTDAASEVRDAVFEGLAAFDSFRNSMNCRVHNVPEEGGPQFVLMYHPDVREFVLDALNPELSNDAARLDELGVVGRANPYLSDADDMYLFVVDPVYSPMVMVKRGEPEFRGPTGTPADVELIMNNQILWQPYYSAEVDYGSAFSAIKLTDA